MSGTIQCPVQCAKRRHAQLALVLYYQRRAQILVRRIDEPPSRCMAQLERCLRPDSQVTLTSPRGRRPPLRRRPCMARPAKRLLHCRQPPPRADSPRVTWAWHSRNLPSPWVAKAKSTLAPDARGNDTSSQRKH
ncbi:hypothetical protein CG017_05780 (plasmid) [Burkholderia glumae]|nr:hypothetical protein CG017_05780 [Burkholderia glumae]